jgi:hypothetical protein
MDAHRLRSVIDLLIAEHRRLEIDSKLVRIQQTLDESASNPCAASDEQFRGALTALLAALRETQANDLVESDRRILAQMDGNRFSGGGLSERALAIANERPFLAARAKAAFGELAAEVESCFQALSATQAGLAKLNVEPLVCSDDSWELGILLPDSLIQGDLQKLLAELKDWGDSFKELLPLFTAGPVWVSLRTYTTDRFELMVPLDRDGALALGLVVARIYRMFRKVRAHRDRAGDLEKEGYPSEIVSRLTAYEQQLVGKHLKAIKEELTKRHVRAGVAKPKEVDKLLDKGLRFMAIRIREGVEVEIVGPAGADETQITEAGADPVTHHVRAALQRARQAKPEPPAGEKGGTGQHEPEAPRIPLSKIAEPTEGEKKAA